jgi:hypothetical protein
MPSSPTVAASTPQAARSHKRVDSAGDHYQTVYDDGRGRYIVECRRRSGKFQCTDAKDEGSNHRSSNQFSDAIMSRERLPLSGSLRHPSSKSTRLGDAKSSRDNFSSGRSLKKTHSAIVIVNTPASRAQDTRSEIKASSKWTEPTPPPTPRLGRLSTPELSDLDEAPFCDCDNQAAMMKYCALCKKEDGFLSRLI